jgi:UDP-glucose 4-epimerase
MNATVLFTGGCGYIGSHTCYQLLENNPNIKIVIIDNLSNCDKSNYHALVQHFPNHHIFLYEYDLWKEKEKCMEVFEQHSIDVVIHFAGLKAVGESNDYPLLYYQNNLISTFHLLECMEKYHCHHLIFSSSATVYGNPQYLPIDENHPLQALNPYGRTKLMIEQILYDYIQSQLQTSIHITILRYFNPVSCHPSGILQENPLGKPNNLFPIISGVYQGKYPHISIFGNDYETIDGTGVRDYIHVVDLAEAHHLCCIHTLQQNRAQSLEDKTYTVYNVGTGNGYSVKQMIESFELIGQKQIPYIYTERRKGDVDSCYADSTKIKNELGWNPIYQLEDMVSHEIQKIHQTKNES